MSQPPQQDDLQIDRFRLVNCIAQGQHSQVWEVIDGARVAAMKLLLTDAFKDSEQKASLKSEHRIGSSFDHPNIIKYQELVVNKKNAYFTMEMFRASNLKAQIYNDLRGVQSRAKRLIELLGLALEHVHEKGWVHKDVKPENILVNKAGEVRLIDFSLSLKTQGGLLARLMKSKRGLIQGTRTYMAPEQIKNEPLTPQTDIYSFGITVFELLCGEPPFKGSTPNDLLMRHVAEPAPAPSMFNPNVTQEMDRLLLKMLEKKPEKRFKSLNEFLMELRRVEVFKEPVDPNSSGKEAEYTDLSEKLDSRADANRTKSGTDTAAPAAKPPAGGTTVAGRPPQPAGAPARTPAPAATQAARPPAGAPPRPAAPNPAARPQPAAPAPNPQTANRPPAAAPPRPAPNAPPAQPGAGNRPAAPAGGAPRPTQPPAARPPQPGAPRPAGQGAGQGGQPRPQQPAQPNQRPAAPPQNRPAAPAPQTRPAAPATQNRPPVAPPKPAPPKPPVSPSPSEGMNIEDLPEFDDLPPVV